MDTPKTISATSLRRLITSKTRPVFSIITVTLNAAQWLEQTILSVLNQRYANIEYIVIDGGSTDNTVTIIRQYEDRLSYWLSEADKGLYDAMNKGLTRATGDYVWFLNAGDTFYAEDILEQTVRQIHKKTALPDILYGGTAIINAQGQHTGLRRLQPPEELLWTSFRHGMLVCHQSFVVRRQIAPLFDLHYRCSADFDWCIRCLLAAANALNLRLILTNYLAGGLTSKQHKLSLTERYHIMSYYYRPWPTRLRHLWFALRYLGSRLRGKTLISLIY